MMKLFGRPQPDWTDRNSVVDYMTSSARLTSGSGGFNEQDVRAAAGSVFDRARRTAKAQRASHLGSMFAAIDCQPRWRERLGGITAPTQVVHGDEDPFFPHGNGVALAAAIPGRHAAHTARHRPGRAARDVAGRRGRPVAPHRLTAALAHAQAVVHGHWKPPTSRSSHWIWSVRGRSGRLR
jgi:pimeloyl-ACP methyl ester carboxylesterase